MEKGNKEKEIVGDGTNLINKLNPFSRDHDFVYMYVFTHLPKNYVCFYSHFPSFLQGLERNMQMYKLKIYIHDVELFSIKKQIIKKFI